MRKPFIKISLLALAISCTALSCKKDSAAKNSTSSDIAFDVTADNSATVVASLNSPVVQGVGTSAVSNNLVWTSGTANISRFKLEAKKNGVETEITTKNLTVNLFAISPATIAAKIDTGTYREIEVSAFLVKSAGTDMPLKLNGTFTSTAGEAVPIEFDYNSDGVIKVEAENVTVDGSHNVSAHMGMHLNRLLSGITTADLEKASRSNGTIVISNASNASIYNQVRVNILLAFVNKGWEIRHK